MTPILSANSTYRAARVALLILACTGFATPGGAAWAQSPADVAGTYRIEGWRDLQGRGMYHFFYLHPGGRFYLAGEWKGSERSRFAGTWSVAGDRVQLTGTADVDTNRGRWTIPFHRTFRMAQGADGRRLTPAPEKNRFGLMGWPNAFMRVSAGVDMNVPGGEIPADAAQLLRLSETLSPAGR